MTSSSSLSSRDELRQLVTTRYVPKLEEIDLEKVEIVRAGCSVLQPKSPRNEDNHIERVDGEDDVVLAEDHRAIHRIDETPKLVTKRVHSSVIPIRDEAVKVLRNLQTTPAESLREERYDFYSQRWFHTTRNSEVSLAEHVLLHPNHRPYFFSMQCRHLETEDVSRLILTSLLSGPRETGQCLARFAIKTAVDMPFKTLFEMLESLAAENDEFQLSDCMVFATLIEQHGSRNITHRLRTDNCKEYGELEPDLDMQGKLMSSRATLTCSARGQKHVLTQITYMNNASGRIDSTSRNRYIELEQTVKCINRRVLIAEEQNILIEYEMEDEMIPLQMGTPPVEDLIEYLRGEDLDDE